MDLSHTFKCLIKPQQDGLTLIEALTQRFPYLSQAEWQNLISSGAVLVNNSPASTDLILKINDQLTTQIHLPEEPWKEIEIPVVYETDSFLLVEKPAGMPVTRTSDIVHNTLINTLRHQRDNKEIQLMHRLDRETTGLILCASNRQSCKQWQRHLNKIIRRKFYLVVVSGNLNVSDHLIQQPLAEKKESTVRCQMHIDPAGKPATTTVHTIATHHDYSLILAELHTGRKHQIRAHLAHLGHPLLGDKIYSCDGYYFLARMKRKLTIDDYTALKATHHTLHAWAMELQLPSGNPHLFFSDHFSQDMEHYLTLFPNWQKKAHDGLIYLKNKQKPLF